MVALVLLLGVLRLIYLREIPQYIHRLFAFYFIMFGLTMLFLEAESRPVQKALVFWIYQGGKSLVNFFLACMAFFNVNLEKNYWWEYAIGVYIGVVALQQLLLALLYINEERDRVQLRLDAIAEEDRKELEEEERRQKEEEEWEKKAEEEADD